MGLSTNTIYNPLTSTLEKCKNYNQFKYFDNRKVSYFKIKNNKVDEIVYFQNNVKKQIKLDKKYFLCAGSIQSELFLIEPAKKIILCDNFKTGLMDTKKVKIVYFFPKMLGKKLIINLFNSID